MYEEQAKMMAYNQQNALVGGSSLGNHNPTVAENIDVKIKALQAEIDRLEASKVALAPLMEMRIRDIRDAMSF